MSAPYEQAVEAAANALRYWCPDCEGTLAVLDMDASRAEGVAMYKACDRCVEGLVRAALLPLLAPIEALADEWEADGPMCAFWGAHTRLRMVLASIKGQPL